MTLNKENGDIMSRAVIKLVNKPRELRRENGSDGLVEEDIYRLPDLDLAETAGISIGGDADQEFLTECRDLLNSFVRDGGRVLVNGHVQREFITGLGGWRKVDFRGVDDLKIRQVTPHPIWEGIELDRFWLTWGSTDHEKEPPPSIDDLRRYGVAGFYGRGYLVPTAADATVINGLGPCLLPVDILLRIGVGEVLVHSGNDLWMFSSPMRKSAYLSSQIVDWLGGTK